MHGAQVGAVVKQVSGKRMPQHVGRDVVPDAGTAGGAFDHLPDARAAHGPAPRADEERPGLRLPCPAHAQPILEAGDGALPEGNEPDLGAFAAYAHGRFIHGDVLQRQGRELGDAQPARVEEFEDCRVADALGGAAIGRVNEPLHLVAGQDVRQCFHDARRVEIVGRVAFDEALAEQKTVKTADGAEMARDRACGEALLAQRDEMIEYVFAQNGCRVFDAAVVEGIEVAPQVGGVGRQRGFRQSRFEDSCFEKLVQRAIERRSRPVLR